MESWKVIGIEDSDGERCECCGTRCPKRRVVLSNGHAEMRYGVNCAAIAVFGNKERLSVDKITRRAKAARYINKRIEKLGTAPEVLRVIADTVSQHWVPCWVESGQIRMA